MLSDDLLLPTPDELSPADCMDRETLAFAAELFSALAHPTRLKIVELLTDGEHTVNDIAQALGLLQPNVSQHLAILHRAGIVKFRPDGAQRCYAVRGPRIARILILVNEFRSIHAETLVVERSGTDGP